MIAANIMTSGVITLTTGDKMIDAVKLIGDKKVRQIPVVDNAGKVAGVVTARRLMQAILPKYVSEGMLEDVRFAPELPEFIENIDRLAFKSIEEVLDKDFVAVTPETQTMEIAALFVNAKKPVETILVVDDHKRLLGVISPWDIFKRLWEYSEKKG